MASPAIPDRSAEIEAAMAGPAGFDAQAAARLSAEELDSHLKELLGWSKEMKGRQRGAGQPQPAGRGPAAAPAAETIRPATPAAAVKASGSGGEHAASKPARHPAAHTYEHYRDKWDRFDPDAALAEEAEEAGGAGGGGTRGAFGSASSKGSRPAGSGAAGSSGAAARVPQARVTVPVSEIGPSAVPAPGAAAPTSAEGWKDAGNTLFRRGAYQKAADAYSRSLEMQPGCLAYANRAMALLKLGKHAEAEADCGRAVALDAAYVKAYQRRATARRQLGNLLGAVEDCEWVLRLEPNNKQAAADRAAWAAELLRREGLELPGRAVAVPVVLAGAGTSGATGLADGAAAAAAGAGQQEAPEVVVVPRKQAAAAAAAGTVGQAGGEPLLTEARTQRLSPAAVAASGAAVPAAAVQAAVSAMAGEEGQAEEDEPMPDLPPEQSTGAVEEEQPEQPAVAAQQQPLAGSPAAPPPASLPALAQQVATPAAQEAAAPAAAVEQKHAKAPAGQQQQKAAPLPAVVAASQPASQPASLKAPRTGVEFEKGWKALKGDPRMQAAYLLTLQPATLPALLKQALTPGLLAAAASSLLGPGLAEQPAAAAALLGALPAVPRFDLNLLSVPQRQRGELARQWDAAAAGLGAAAGGEQAGLGEALAAARLRWKL